MRRAAWFFLALSSVPVAIHAQKCIGQTPWSSGPLKLGGSLEFGGGLTDIGGALSVGRDHGFFVAAGAGAVTYNWQVFLSAAAGKELSKPLAGKVTICPIVNLAYFLKRYGASELSVSGGLSGGYPVALNSKAIGLTLTGSAQLGYRRRRIDPGFCDVPQIDCSDFLGIFGIGAGFSLHRISLVPRLLLPTQGSISLLIVANLAIGKRL
jgi:hypothetical protein